MIELNKERKFYLFASILLLISLFLSKIFDLLVAPVFSNWFNHDYGNVIAQIFKIIFYLIVIICYFIFTKKLLNYNIALQKRKTLSLKRQLFLFGLVLACFLIKCIIFKFNDLSLFYELGKNSTKFLFNCRLLRYLAEIVELFVAILFLATSQEFFDNINIINAKIAIPYGGILLLITFGLLQLFTMDYKIKLLLFAFYLIYGIIYLINNKKFISTFIFCLILFIL